MTVGNSLSCDADFSKVHMNIKYIKQNEHTCVDND